MNKAIKTLLSSIISLVVVISCLSFPVSADTTKNIELDQYLHSETECTPFTEYKVIIPQTTYYHFRLITTGLEYDSVEVDMIPEMDKTSPYFHIFDSKGTEYLTYHEVWWKSGAAYADSTHYLEKGEYTFYISSKDYCNLFIDGFDGEIYITEDGKRIDQIFSVYSNRANYNYIYDNGNHEYSVVLKPGNRGIQYTIYTTELLSSERKLDETVTMPLSKDDQYGKYVPIYFPELEGGSDVRLAFDIKVLGNGKASAPNGDYDSYRNYLADKDQSNSISFREKFKNAATGKEMTDNTVDFNYPNAYYLDWISYPNFVYCFIKDKSSKNKIELDKKYDVAPALFSSKNMDSQVVYSFTPSKDSVYNLSSEGMGANPYVAIFDSNDNCIGWYDSDKNVTDYTKNDYTQLLLKCIIDFNLNLDIELKAGQTYYFYFTNSFAYQEFLSRRYSNTIGFDKSNPYSFKLTEKSVEPTNAKENTEVQPSTPTKEGTFEDFVERLYVVALERDSEPEGKAFWCEKVNDGTYDGAYCARFFLTSPEFLGKNKTDEQFVDTLYRTFFDREADDEGRAFWIKKIKESSKETVIEGFINSTEWCNICASYGVKSGAQWAKATVASKNATAFATRLYTECLGRDAETEGLNYWSLSLTNLERTGTQAAKEFFYSDEFLSKNLSNEEYVMRLYGTFMGRTPEAEGKAYWLDLLNNGGSRDEVFNFFASCPEFTEICTKYAIDR